MAKTNPIPKKLCIKCNASKPVNEFYNNRDWLVQSCKDAWCRDCTNNFIQDETSLREYCWYNNREYNTLLWERANEHAMYILNNDSGYMKMTKSNKEKKLMATRIKQYLKNMNLASYYLYVNNIDGEGTFKAFNENEAEYRDKEIFNDQNDTHYDKLWAGYYSNAQIEYLETYYQRLSEEFPLDTESVRDYARKTAKASLAADMAQQEFQRGKISSKELKEVLSVFNDLSQNGAFAEAKRKKTDRDEDMGSLGELILMIERNEAIDKKQQKYEKDEIDAVLEQFRHIVTAVGKE